LKHDAVVEPKQDAGDTKEAVAIIDELVRRFGNDTSPEVRRQVAIALLNKGFALIENLDDPKGGLEAMGTVLAKYCDGSLPENDGTCLIAQADSVEPLIVLGKDAEALQRIDAVQRRLDPEQPEYAIMTFLAWVADPQQHLQAVLDAIRQVDFRSKPPKLQQVSL
jgi:hypothetical protein